MRPLTVHAGAQLVRHTRGLLATIEKWAAGTPPELLHEEIDALLFLVRGGLNNVNTKLGTPQPHPAAPLPADNHQR